MLLQEADTAPHAADGVSVAGFLQGWCVLSQTRRVVLQDAREDVDLTADSALAELASETGTTRFTGYAELLGPGNVVRLVRDGDVVETCCEGDSVDVVLDTTPFYAESGGQVGDTGVLTVRCWRTSRHACPRVSLPFVAGGAHSSCDAACRGRAVEYASIAVGLPGPG